jgi:acetylornithine deacetylase
MPSRTAPESAESLLAAMVSMGTVNPAFGGPPDGQAGLGAYLETLAQSWGLRTQREPVPEGGFNLIVATEVLPNAEWILFESHLDTVSVEGMTVAPFALTERNGRLYGRGACDTKGSGAAMLWALRDFAGRPGRPRNAGIVFVVDEEAGMTGAQTFARGTLRSFARLRGIVVGEPTQLRPVVAHNGALRWRTITRGVAAHSSDPTKGRSAISAMVKVVAALEEHFVPLARAEHRLTGRAAASINVIRGGQAGNIIPDYCEIHCDRRLVPGEELDAVLADRDRVLAGLTVEHDGVYLAPPLPPETSASFHRWLQPAFSAHAIDGQGLGAPYATDASHYAAAGAPVVVLGPGDIGQAHTRDEWLARDALEQAVAFYGSVLNLPS